MVIVVYKVGSQFNNCDGEIAKRTYTALTIFGAVRVEFCGGPFCILMCYNVLTSAGFFLNRERN